ncbi:hypothetical protein KIH75_09535, partial [Bifidobacterium sp. 64T4]|uniref:hypothetical protein n=1 Tax=Bifidobacterium pongonis TaxID=2834432 RepID=UPI001C55C31A
ALEFSNHHRTDPEPSALQEGNRAAPSSKRKTYTKTRTHANPDPRKHPQPLGNTGVRRRVGNGTKQGKTRRKHTDGTPNNRKTIRKNTENDTTARVAWLPSQVFMPEKQTQPRLAMRYRRLAGK